jgi:DNA-binding CsgD family transcriptional regulator
MRIEKFTELSNQAAGTAELIALYKRALYGLGFRKPPKWARKPKNAWEEAQWLFHQFRVAFLRLQGKAKADPTTAVSLSDHEREVLHWSARGLTIAAIARMIDKSPFTVDFHMRNARRKLGANKTTLAVSKAQHLGLIDFKPPPIDKRVKARQERAVKRKRALGTRLQRESRRRKALLKR